MSAETTDAAIVKVDTIKASYTLSDRIQALMKLIGLAKTLNEEIKNEHGLDMLNVLLGRPTTEQPKAEADKSATSSAPAPAPVAAAPPASGFQWLMQLLSGPISTGSLASGGIGLVALNLLHSLGAVGSSGALTGSTTGSILTTLATGLAGAGAAGKFSTIATSIANIASKLGPIIAARPK